MPFERPTGYQTAHFRRQDLLLFDAQFQVCRDMSFRSSHGFEMRKYDKRVAKQDIDTAHRTIVWSLQTREQRIDKQVINTASCRTIVLNIGRVG